MAYRSFLPTLLFLSLAASAFGQTELKWRFKPGEKFYQETTTTRRQVIRVMGQETKVDHQFVMVSSFLVEKKNDDGSVILKQTIESVKPLASAGADAVPHVAKKLEGVTFTIHLSPTMQVTTLEGYDDFIKSIGVGDAGYERVAKALTPESVLRAGVEETFGSLKPGPLASGAEWMRNAEVSLGPLGSVALTRKFQLGAPEKNGNKELQKILVATTAVYAPPTGDPGILPFRILKGDVKVTDGEGTLWFDAAAGRLAHSTSTLKLKGELALKLMDAEQTVAIDQEQTIKIRLLERNPLPEKPNN